MKIQLQKFSITPYFVFFTLSFFSCKVTNHLAETRAKTVQIVNQSPDADVEKLVVPYRLSLNSKMNEVLAYCSENIIKDRPESPLTNWVADAIYNQSIAAFSEPIAFAYQNYGGIRIPHIGKGDVTLGKIYELMPFDNFAILVKLNTEELLKFADYIAQNEGAPVSSSVKLEISGKSLKSLRIHGNTVVADQNQIYHVVMPDYIANGGDDLSFLQDNPKINKNILIRDMLAAEARLQKQISPVVDHRIVIK